MVETVQIDGDTGDRGTSARTPTFFSPVLTNPTTFWFLEDTPAPLVFPAPPFGTSDAPPTKQMTVTLQIERGAIRAVSGMGVSVGGTGLVSTFQGTLADLNRFFTDPAGQLRYRPAADDHGSRSLTVTVAELTLRGVLRSSSTATLEITPVNDAEAAGGVTVGGTATARTFTGETNALNTYCKSLGRITYTTARDNTAMRLLTTTVSDGETASVISSQITVTPVNDRPTLAPTATLRGVVAVAQAELRISMP